MEVMIRFGCELEPLYHEIGTNGLARIGVSKLARSERARDWIEVNRPSGFVLCPLRCSFSILYRYCEVGGK